MRNQKWCVLVIFLLLLPAPAAAIFAAPTYFPVDRLLANTRAFVDENPNSHEGYYTLARIHYLAFANKVNLVAATDVDGSLPQIEPDWLLRGGVDVYPSDRRRFAEELALEKMGYSSESDVPEEEWPKYWKIVMEKHGEFKKLDKTKLLEHASAAAASFRKAVDLDSKNALYHLGLASLYQQYLQFAEEAKVVEHPPELKGVTLEKAREVYYSAYAFSIEEDLKLEERPVSGLESLAGYEAGNAYVRLAEAVPSLSKEEKRKAAQVRGSLRKLRRLPRGAITPIVFSLEQRSSLAELIEPASRVLFDLDGDGAAEYWPWVKPTTALLVWDPEEKGLIGSGRQLFGTALWWLFFPNGYRALDALDDNRDGTLSGLELQGIAVWFDRNSNGRSDHGEVVPVEAVGVRALETRFTGEDNGSPMNKAGLTLIDGSVLPTYDWVTSPIGSAVTLPLNRDNYQRRGKIGSD